MGEQWTRLQVLLVTKQIFRFRILTPNAHFSKYFLLFETFTLKICKYCIYYTYNATYLPTLIFLSAYFMQTYSLTVKKLCLLLRTGLMPSPIFLYCSKEHELVSCKGKVLRGSPKKIENILIKISINIIEVGGRQWGGGFIL